MTSKNSVTDERYLANLLRGNIHITGDGNVIGSNNRVTIIKQQGGDYSIQIGQLVNIVLSLSDLQQILTQFHAPEPFYPPETNRFIGRDQELAYLVRTLQNHHLAIISGMAGVGKTALASALANIWQTQQAISSTGEYVPNKQKNANVILDDKHSVFWHTFHSKNDIASLIWNLAEFLDWQGQSDLLQRLQISNFVQQPPAILLDNALRMMKGQGYLICLDDVHNIQENDLFEQLLDGLRNLIRLGEVSLIITSRGDLSRLRSPLTFDALTGLSVSDVGHLATSYKIPLTPDMTQRLRKITGGNPELLTWAINLLKENLRKQTGSLDQTFDQMAQSPDIDRYLFREVNDNLLKNEQAVMITMSFFSYPSTREAIEAVSQHEHLEKVLLSLADRHLLTIQYKGQNKLYQVHAMMCTFYKKIPSEGEQQAIHSRAAEYYELQEEDILKAISHYELATAYEKAATLATADNWGLISQGHRDVLFEVLDRLKTQQLNHLTQAKIIAGLALIHHNLNNYDAVPSLSQEAYDLINELDNSLEVQQLRTKISLNMVDYLLKFGKPKEAEDWIRGCFSRLTDYNLKTQQAELRIAAARVLRSLRDYPNARDQLQRGIWLLPNEAIPQRIDALNVLSVIDADQGKLDDAIESVKKALDLSQLLKDELRAINILTNLALYQQLNGDWINASENYEQAQDLADKLGNDNQRARIAHNLGYLYMTLGEENEAIKLFSKSLDLAREKQIDWCQVYVQSDLAHLYILQNNREKARYFLSNAEKLAYESNIDERVPEVNANWALLHLLDEQVETALDRAQHAYNTAKELEIPAIEGSCLRVLGQAFLANQRVEEALIAFNQSVSLLSDDPYETARTRLEQGKHFLNTADKMQGCALLIEAQNTFVKLKARREEAITIDLLAQYNC